MINSFSDSYNRWLLFDMLLLSKLYGGAETRRSNDLKALEDVLAWSSPRNGSSDAILPKSFVSVMNKLFSVSSPPPCTCSTEARSPPSWQGSPVFLGWLGSGLGLFGAQIFAGRRRLAVPVWIGCPPAPFSLSRCAAPASAAESRNSPIYIHS